MFLRSGEGCQSFPIEADVEEDGVVVGFDEVRDTGLAEQRLVRGVEVDERQDGELIDGAWLLEPLDDGVSPQPVRRTTLPVELEDGWGHDAGGDSATEDRS